MEWVSSLRGQVVGIDTAPVIYYIERNPRYIDLMHAFFQEVSRGECAVVTSVMTWLEGLVIPTRVGNRDLIRQYYDLLFYTRGITTYSLFPNTAKEAARLRAFHNIRTPDSIQMATAIIGGASIFLTNDIRLPSLPGLKTLVLENLRKDL